MLGVATGGVMHGAEGWEAVGVPWAERGRRTDEALALLPGRLAERAHRLPETAEIAVRAVAPLDADETPAQAAERFAAYADAGATWLVLSTPGDWNAQWELIAEAATLLG